MEKACAFWFRVRRQGEPISHAYEETQRPGRTARSARISRAKSRPSVWTGPLPIAAALASRYRTLARILAYSAKTPASCDRIPRFKLVYGRCVQASHSSPCCSVPTRHGRFGDRAHHRRTIRLRSISWDRKISRPL